MATVNVGASVGINTEALNFEGLRERPVLFTGPGAVVAEAREEGEVRRVVIEGQGFTYPAPNALPVSGTINKYTLIVDGVTLYSIEGLGIAVPTFLSWVDRGAEAREEALRTLFGGADEINGGGRGDALASRGGADTLSGEGGNDLLAGQGGDDTMDGGPGNDTLRGGQGFDNAVFDSMRNANAIDYISIFDAYQIVGPEGTDFAVADVERLDFIDGALNFSAESNIAQASRLYWAAFNRTADPTGLNNWADALDRGASLQSVAQGFLGSQEFQARYGDLGDVSYVRQLYLNVLGRGPDAQGLENWVDNLEAGMSRAGVMIGFSESDELKLREADTYAEGLWDIDENAATTARLYLGVLDRLPDAGGLANWTRALESGAVSALEAARGFTDSIEFQERYGDLDDEDFVQLLYLNVLGRRADAGGLSSWTGRLDDGAGREAVVLGFTESEEFKIATSSFVADGVDLA